MALTKDQKKAQVAELRDAFQRSKSLVWMQYSGLGVLEVSELRRKISQSNASMKVAKKTLFRIAAQEEGFPEPSEEAMEGPVAFVFSFEDEVSGAKVALEFSKTHEQVKLIGGMLNGQILSAREALDLAKMLSREETLAQLLCTVRSPLVSFASVCNTPLRSFAIGLRDLAEKGGVPTTVSTS